ncbi:MAG: DUF2306 domain-containing protein [Pseudomonadota bacterium]|nr:DUF2306 domain-containing protein [Pseudomonadota bacterium]
MRATPDALNNRNATSGPGGADSVLAAAAGFWLLTALIGQWLFFYYIASFYGPAMATGNYEGWAVLSAMGAKGYVEGDTAGNMTFGAHALAAGIIAFGGALQLIPQIRAKAPVFHRWNGRLFLLTVVGLSLTGFYLVWGRGSPPDSIGEMATTLNGVLILTFAGLAGRHAMARRITIHRRWAMRLYLVSNAQWFMRIGVFAWFVGNMALGNKVSMTDPFMSIWPFGCYLVPLAVLELYLRARDRGGPIAGTAVAALLVALTLLMGLGIFAFFMFSQKILSGAPLSLG